jgi:hypothetical protein
MNLNLNLQESMVKMIAWGFDSVQMLVGTAGSAVRQISPARKETILDADFNIFLAREICALGSARALACRLRRPRRNPSFIVDFVGQEKFAMARAPSPAREARALPGTNSRARSLSSVRDLLPPRTKPQLA